MTAALPLTGRPEADEFLADDPLALLIGMLLDQQVPMERAFSAPYDLRDRLAGNLDCGSIAAMDPDSLAALFAERPALHRYPRAMAGRTQELCRMLDERFGGEAARVWTDAPDGKALYANVKSLPGFGEQKARIFVALLAKRLGVRPPGWEEVAGPYAQPGWFSVADIDGPDALLRVREHKKAVKAEAKAAKAGPAGG